MDPAEDGLPIPQRYWAILTLMVGVALSCLDTALVNVALPRIAKDLNSSPADSIWVVNAYQLAVMISLLPLASFGDIFGYRRVYRFGLVLYTSAALISALAGSLGTEQVEYLPMQALGGLRHARKDSPNTGWRNASFRGYADYMQTEQFQAALEALIAMSRQKRAAIMCAEAVPWRCHRSLVADALSARGVPVIEVLSESSYRAHKLTPFALVEGMRVTYPPEQAKLL